MNTWFTVLSSPVGSLRIVVDDRSRLLAIDFHIDSGRGTSAKPSRAKCARVAQQLREYFRGERRRFELELRPSGTDFQRSVWKELLRVPYGTTITYRELARRVGRPKAVRAVGQANGRNPIPIVVPCHRVIGADGKLTGFGGGLDVKRRLLDLEGAVREASLFD